MLKNAEKVTNFEYAITFAWLLLFRCFWICELFRRKSGENWARKKETWTFRSGFYGGRYKTRIQDIACYIVLKCIKIALFASFDELFCPVLFLLLPTCVNLLRLKISKTFGRYIPLTSRVRRTPYSATKTTAVHRRILICQSIITEVNSSINRQSFLYIIFGVFPAYFPA